VHDVAVDHTRARFSVDAPELNRVLAHLVEFDVRSLTSSPPTLEELFVRHYGDVIETLEADTELVGAR
jgi:ABC-2 type transport system ATP-binding protein